MINILLNGLILGFVSSPTCPSNAEEIRWGSREGFGAALAVGLGAVTGDAVVLVVVLLGLYPLLQAYPSAAALLWLVGSVVLAYIAIGMVREAVAATATEPQATPSGGHRRPFLTGFVITTFNPFTIFWWFGLLGAWTLGTAGLTFAFPLAVLTGSLLWFVGLAALLHLGRSRLTAAARRWILAASALILFAYAGWLLVHALRAI